MFDRRLPERWNLLGLAAGAAASVYSGQPETGFAILAAAEAAWLTFAATSPAYRRHVDIAEHQRKRDLRLKSAERRMRKMLFQLPRPLRDRYTTLEKQCDQLKDIGRQYQISQGADENDLNLTDLNLDGLDGLLWTFLKLLHAEHSLNRFFETTDPEGIDSEIRQIEQQLQHEEMRLNAEDRDRVLQSLHDSLETCRERRRNYDRTRSNLEFVQAEQTRLENKIRSLAETGIGQGGTDHLSGRIDDITGSLTQTNQTLRELNLVTDLSDDEDDEVIAGVGQGKDRAVN